MNKNIGRNDKCWCGSGKKYKYCHLNIKQPTKLEQPTNREECFRKIFEELPFPYFATDLWMIAKVINNKAEPRSFVGIKLIPNNPKNDALRGAIRGIFRKISPPKSIFSFLENSDIIKKELQPISNIENLIEARDNHFGIYTKDGNLIWEEGSYWPLAYSTFINQISNIIQLFNFALTNRVKELSSKSKHIDINISSEYARNLPTRFHYAAASLGAWSGGAMNVQYFSLYASYPQITKKETNIKYAIASRYSEDDAIELDNSGIISIPITLAAPLLEAQGNNLIFGSIPVDEFNMVNMPNAETVNYRSNINLTNNTPIGFIIDKYYRSPFFSRTLTSQALYGPNNVLRDHYEDFYSSISQKDLLRCKHYCMPVIEVSNVHEINELISRIPKRGHGQLFFRGQTSFYEIERTDNVKQLLFGNSHSSEPSLITSAARTNYDYDSLHFALKYFVGQDRLFKDENDSTFLNKKMEKWHEMSVDPSCKYDYAIMALAQHYGLPSHGLDVTTNIDVALWFATNKFSQDEQGYSNYKKIDKDYWKENKKKWPIIFIFQNILNTTIPSLQDCQELTELGITALRPERQSAKFFLGGHSDHQNRLAEALVCAIRLCPNEYPTTCDFDYLFPTQEDDDAYKVMIEFSKNSVYSSLGNNKVNLFHHIDDK